ncbi:hypothetical protein SDRG_12907 [Saprolegnia diclina VS20]|uniref:Uncharacterized protein n=1 Tax=Saprolegnia diclina (strain VS20) TaxID=1156394 RepID=T0Q7K9_SAPDV|nr:hypothetical protein SDRG_12907 [Saprolegnia diclina VS20]EQC29445.1 hypothetical protein SDRG_12907 [Saprolegnia diclina VS20]|eukprot:XP_008617212.1 hypothetical protein SDRG_12907 [Saprolegnia diclina VS20]
MPEVVERMATYLMTSEDMAAFLQALPDDWLSEPLAALRQLYRTVQTRRLAVPADDMRYPIHTKLRLNAVRSWAKLQQTIAQWPGRIERIELLIDLFEADWPSTAFESTALALTTLREIAVRFDRCADYDLRPIIQTLASTSVTSLKLLGLGHLRSLLHCRLFEIQFSRACVTSLASLLPQLTALQLAVNGCHYLEFLELSHQNLKDASAKSLAAVATAVPVVENVQSLGIVHRLDTIHLANNVIGVNGAIAISLIVPQACHLTSMNLDGNQLKTKGAVSILSALANCDYHQGAIDVHDTLADDESDCECADAMEALPDATWASFHDDDARHVHENRPL